VKVKKLLSFVLVAAMMLSVFVLPATAVSENEIVVHYYNENNWESPYIYYYNDGNTPVSWPGTAMNNDGDNWYSYTISGYSSAKVIFSNNGADQYPAQNQEGLTVSGEKWYKSGSFYDQNPDLSKVSVHYYNSNQWSSPYIYYYTDSETPITWPGTAMTSDGNGWYSYDIYGFDEVKVIFSDNGANQIPQQNETGYTVTGEKWFINGTLYDAEPDGITVHFYDYNNWGNVNIYYYNGNLEGTSWTGVPMYADGDGWYTYKIYGYDEARVLFNNGRGTQIPDVMVEGFPVSDEMWYRNGTWTTERPDEITVYFYKPDGWSAPNIYYYLNDSDTGPAWPGSAMTEVSDGWYAYTITKYASAKVMFNDGTNQIPAQNQPGLDATGIMWYKNGVWCNSESDTDSDELLDYMELVLGTNINNVDTDGDGLPDGYEVMTLGTDPLKADSDDNGTTDGQEDADSDTLNNLREYQLGTDPNKADTDNDGLSDSEEVNTYNTTPLEKDTDGDTLSDGDDVALGFSPLLQDTDGNGVLDCDEKVEQTISQSIEESEKPEVTDVTVSFSGTGNINNTTTIESIYNVDMLSSEVVGLVGAPVEITSTSQFDEAVITFTYDDTQLGDVPEENLSIMWYDEENNWFKILDQESVVDTENNTVSVTTTHFSKYMLVNKEEWFETWIDSINYTRDENVGYNFAFVVDTSGSMYGDRLARAKEALINFADSLYPNDIKSLISFNSTAKVESWSNEDIDQFKEAVANLQANGGTSVSAGLGKALVSFTAIGGTQEKIIILICDGDVNNCDASINYCIENDIKIYTVNVETADNSALKSMAEKTGGLYYMATSSQDLARMMQRINLEIDQTDSDEDGLPDILEEQGMITTNGQIYQSNPQNPDSDNDGVPDGVEMGVPEGEDYRENIIEAEFTILGIRLYCVFFDAVSNPQEQDSDNDGDKDDIDPHPVSYQLNDQFIYQLDKLEKLAYEYNDGEWDILMKYSIDKEYWLSFMFIRQFADGSANKSNYINGNWPVVGGEIDWGFVNYVYNNNPSLYNYFSSLEYIYANKEGDIADIRHLAATATVYIYETDLLDAKYFSYLPYDEWYDIPTNLQIEFKNATTVVKTEMLEYHFNNLGGWAGDLQTLMINTYIQLDGSDNYDEFYNKFYQLIGDNDFSLSMKDLYADTDAYNIYTLLDGTSNCLADSTKTYYSDGYKKRYSSFTNNWNRETILNLVKTYTNTNYLLDIDMLRWPLFNESNKVDGTEYYNFSENQSNASAEAFTDFLMHQLQKER